MRRSKVAWPKSRRVLRHYARARTLSEAGCRAGYAQSCYIHGHLLREGLGGPKYPVKGKALIDKACELGSIQACAAAHP